MTVSAVLSGVGKSAAVEKENAQLKADIERIKKAFPNAVKNKVEELTKALVEAKQSAEAERDRALEQSRSSVIEKNEAVRQLQEQEADIQQRISRAVLTATKKERQHYPFCCRRLWKPAEKF